jgi:membrane-associated phospholipid phosphatase
LTRLGEAEILIPAAALVMLVLMAQSDTRRFTFIWLALTTVATLITTASKLAFIGWGLGLADFNFTGVSGHAMFATAIYPVLALSLLPRGSWAGRKFAFSLGGALALLVGQSRLVVGAHSESEVLAGWLLGGAASALSVRFAKPPVFVVHPTVPIILVVWLLVMPLKLPGSQTHSRVTRLALAMSGHAVPFTRSQRLKLVRTPG